MSQFMVKFSRNYIADVYLALILFGQVFLSSLANLLNVDNRPVMVALRLSILTI